MSKAIINIGNNKSLRDYQNKAEVNVFENENGLYNNDRAQLIMACGTGKTFVAQKIIERNVLELNKNNITLLLFPSLYLINQTYTSYKNSINVGLFNPLIVCSDKNTKDDEEKFEIDINEVNYPVTTQVEDIKDYLSDDNIKNKIIFVTYHSSYQVGLALRGLDLFADLAIFDEAHKTAIKNNKKDDSYACGLSDSCIPIRKRLFMTATPKHFNFEVEDGIIDETDDKDVAFSMDNEELYGKISYEYAMRDAINDGWIADYKVLGILIDDDYIKRFKKANSKKIEDSVECENILTDLKAIKAKAIEQTMKKFGIKRALAFHNTIKDSKEFAELSNDDIYSNLTISHIDGTTKHENRKEIIDNLKNNENYIVSNSRLLTEGVDVPSIDMVAILKNMGSKIDMVQTVGRVQRFIKDSNDNVLDEDKIGYVLLPIFVSSLDMSDDEIKKDIELNTLYNVINSLKENDKQLRSELSLKKESRKQAEINADEKLNNELETKEDEAVKSEDNVFENENSDLKSHIEINHIGELSEYYSEDEKIDYKFREALDRFTDKVEGVVLNSRLATKEDWINATLDYIEKYGYESLKATTKHTYNGVEYNIGNWRTKRKTDFKKLTTQGERDAMIEEFNCIHEDYLLDSFDVSKRNNINATLDYIEKYGYESLKATTKHTYNGVEYNIGGWRKGRRADFKKLTTQGERDIMIEEFSCIHEDYLLEHGDVFKRNNINTTLDFIEKYGYESLKFGTKHTYNGVEYNIGGWRNRRRTEFKKLTTQGERDAMIEEFSCIHEDYLLDSFDVSKRNNINATLDYVEKYGYESLKARTKHTYNGVEYNIGGWRKGRRADFKKLTTQGERDIMIEEFSVFPLEYLGKGAVVFAKEQGLSVIDGYVKL